MAFYDELQDEITEELRIELSSLGEAVPNDDVLSLKVKDAIREVVRERNYPETYTEEMILSDLERLYANVKAKAVYKGNLIGSEYESSHTENGVSRAWIEYERLSNGIIPIARVS